MFLSHSKAASQSVIVRVVRSPDHENMGLFFIRGSGGGRRKAFREGRRSCMRRLPKPRRRWAPQQRGWGQAHTHYPGICGLHHPSRHQCLHDVCSTLVRSPSSILVSSMSLDFRCSTKSPEVGSRRSVHVHVSHFVPSLIDFEVNVRSLDDECIDLPVNN